MGTALFKIKLMPEDASMNLVVLQEYAKEAVEEAGGEITTFEEQEIAFGLKALIVGVRLDESLDSNKLEEALGNIDGVSSLDIIDYRRAIE